MTHLRTFKFLTVTKSSGEVSEFIVTDMTKEELEKEQQFMESLRSHEELYKYKGNEKVRKRVATFPVSELYDEHSQRQRAQHYVNYMNEIQDATNKAIEHATLMAQLKS